MSPHSSNVHLSAEQLQALLEGEMPNAARSRAEEHLTGCARCSAELDAWATLFADLGALPGHGPTEGFADRVLSGVTVPVERPLAARLRDQLTGRVPADAHVSSGVLQDFLDGALADRRAGHIERHLAACGVCTDEADAWIDVMRRLSGLERFAPSEGFSERVMASVDVRVTVSLSERVRSWLGWVPSPAPEHVPPGILQDWVDGLLPTHTVARVWAHVATCTDCAHEADAWERIAARLNAVGHLAPSPGFADRVMHGFTVAPVRTSMAAAAQERALGLARRFVPRTRRAWAALSGAAVTPAVVAGLVVYVLFSHPTLTLGSLASFAWWQLADLATVAVSALTAALPQSPDAFGLGALIRTLSAAPSLVAGGVLVYTLASALALRVLYKNLIANRPRRGRYAHVSTVS